MVPIGVMLFLYILHMSTSFNLKCLDVVSYRKWMDALTNDDLIDIFKLDMDDLGDVDIFNTILAYLNNGTFDRNIWITCPICDGNSSVGDMCDGCEDRGMSDVYNIVEPSLHMIYKKCRKRDKHILTVPDKLSHITYLDV